MYLFFTDQGNQEQPKKWRRKFSLFTLNKRQSLQKKISNVYEDIKIFPILVF